MIITFEYTMKNMIISSYWCPLIAFVSIQINISSQLCIKRTSATIHFFCKCSQLLCRTNFYGFFLPPSNPRHQQHCCYQCKNLFHIALLFKLLIKK